MTKKKRHFSFNNKIYIFIIVLLTTAVALLISFNLSPKAKKINGWIHTRGATILDSANREVVIRGINYDEMTPLSFVYHQPDLTGLPDVCRLWNRAPTKLDAKEINKMGFNAVRLVLNWDNLEPLPPTVESGGNLIHKWNMDYVQAVDKTINDLKKEKIAVILDMHQYLWSSAFKYIVSEDGQGCAGGGMPAWLYPDVKSLTFQEARCDFFKNIKYPAQPINPQDGFLEAWKFLVERYKHNDSVIAADIINEPWMVKGLCSPEDLDLNSFYEKYSIALRKINPNLVLILEDSQDFTDTPLALSKPEDLTNILYSFHLYTGNWNPDGLNRVERFLQRATDWNIPLYIGEFDGFGWSNNLSKIDEPKLTREITSMMDYFKKKQVNWTFWSYSGMYSIMDPETKKAKIPLLKALQRGF